MDSVAYVEDAVQRSIHDVVVHIVEAGDVSIDVLRKAKDVV